MKVKDLKKMIEKLDDDSEIAVEYVTEKDVMDGAESRSITCTQPQAQKIIQAIDSDGFADTDHLVEYYLDLFEKGDLAQEKL